MARQLGVNQFRVVNPFDVRWDDPGIRPAAVKAGVRKLDWLSIANRPENWNPFPDSVESGDIARAFERPWAQAQPAADALPPRSGHPCHWLYKNIVMDATGRIMPCCGAPRPDTNLVFATFDGDGGDPVNYPRHRQARAWFAGGANSSDDAPYCTRCEWDQTTVNIGGPEIKRYLRAADAAFFDARSLRSLSDW